VQRSWANDIDEDWVIENGDQTPTAFEIPEADKVIVRANLVETIIHSPQLTRAQLLHALGKIAIADYPEKYSELLPKLMAYITSNDQNVMSGALLSLYELTKKYEFKNSKDRAPLMKIVAESFPVLHRLFTTCVQHNSVEAALVLKSIAKIYFSCIQYSLPQELRVKENLAPWIQVFLQLIEKPSPPVPADTEPSLRHKFPWWQAKKWGYHILNRLFTRYANPSLSSDEYKKFAKEFLKDYAPQILQSYLKQLDAARNNQYVSPRVLQLNLTFLTDAVDHAPTWKILKGISIDLVKSILFPLLCFSNEDQELWESDPYEFVKTKFDLYEYFRSPVPAASQLIHQLVTSRKKTTLIPILSFCNQILLNYQATPLPTRNYRAKDGALAVIGTISGILEKDENFSSQLEGLLVAHVFSEADSPAPFLRARACWAIHNFADVPFSNPENILRCLQVVAKCMKDGELPVKIQAALALGVLIDKEPIQQQLRPMLSEVMQELLNLTNESDIDDLSTVMEAMIETFGEDMAPFAVSLTTQLRDTFMRMIGEADGEEDENKALAAMGVLRTIVTFIRMMDESQQILAQLEQVLLPLMQSVLDQALLDFFEEIFEMITTFTYNADKISPAMWAVYPSIYNCFKQSAFDYFNDMLPCFDNYISRDANTIISNPQLLNMLIDMTSTIIQGNESGEVEKSNACKLIEVMLLNMTGQIDQLIPGFIESNLAVFQEAETTSLKVCSLEVVINSIYYNPLLALGYLDSKNHTNPFFTAWFTNIQKFTRVHDIKLCLLTLCKIFLMNFNDVPATVRAGYHQAMLVVIDLFRRLPDAYKHRKELEEMEEEEEEEEDGEEIEDEDDEGNEGEDIEDEDVINPDDVEYMNLLREAGKHRENGDDDDDDFYGDDVELEEELEQTTPLDQINEYIVFQETFKALSHQNQGAFSALTQGLDATQMQFLNELNNLADQKRTELAQKAQGGNN